MIEDKAHFFPTFLILSWLLSSIEPFTVHFIHKDITQSDNTFLKRFPDSTHSFYMVADASLFS